jgi:hypothetical protein
MLPISICLTLPDIGICMWTLHHQDARELLPEEGLATSTGNIGIEKNITTPSKDALINGIEGTPERLPGPILLTMQAEAALVAPADVLCLRSHGTQ